MSLNIFSFHFLYGLYFTTFTSSFHNQLCIHQVFNANLVLLKRNHHYNHNSYRKKLDFFMLALRFFLKSSFLFNFFVLFKTHKKTLTFVSIKHIYLSICLCACVRVKVKLLNNRKKKNFFCISLKVFPLLLPHLMRMPPGDISFLASHFLFLSFAQHLLPT